MDTSTKLEILAVLGLIGWFVITKMHVVMFIRPTFFVILGLVILVIFLLPSKK